jgi:hypothetical protein
MKLVAMIYDQLKLLEIFLSDNALIYRSIRFRVSKIHINLRDTSIINLGLTETSRRINSLVHTREYLAASAFLPPLISSFVAV